MCRTGNKAAFTLIELSIVLVIIGLIVGGILVGQDLIKAAEVRAQISQIEKYNQAVNTFRSKFNAIPGDMAISTANQFGFPTTGCDGAQSQRDGNGLIDGGASPFVLGQTYGETPLFWQDISSSVAGNLIEGSFPGGGAVAGGCGSPGSLSLTPGTTYIGDFFPAAKIGHGSFLYVYETSGYNWFGLSAVTSTNSGNGSMSSTVSIPVVQAYSMDKKVDDGLPTTGAVQATYVQGSTSGLGIAPNAATDTTTSCYNTTSNAYSTSSLANYGAGGNCALSFRFQ